MQFKNPADVMRAKILDIHVRCNNCDRFIAQALPWCEKHELNPRKPGETACPDFAFNPPPGVTGDTNPST